MENDIYNEAFSSVDFETNDVTIQPTPASAHQNQVQDSFPPYEPLDNPTQVVRSQSLNSYEALNHDVWSESFPIRGRQIIETSQLQPISNVLDQKVTT